ncbi:hypothetical protein [Microbacterium sp.]|uniref:hypothetical protein n=1 Tax=Microbacterium sp. TaxID=51671 RepID=UPI003F949AE3
MNRSQKVAVVVSALVVAGLVAVAAPAVVSVAAEVGTWAPLGQPTDAPAATPTITSAPSSTPAPGEHADAPTGYVDVGYGTSIPAGGPGDCESSAYIWIGSVGDEPMHADLTGADLVDMGPREFAIGEVGLDDQGRPATYTVAPGDATYAIGDRFCIYNGLALETLNGYSHGAVIQPGDVLTLNADLVTDWVDPYADE